MAIPVPSESCQNNPPQDTVLDPLRTAQPMPRHLAPTVVSKDLKHYSKQDWATVIDETWGEGMPTVDKLAFFDEYWALINEFYACFHDLNADWWDSLHDQYRTEIEGGVSRGRFCAIMNHFARRLMETHTQCHDLGVVLTQLDPGIPLLWVGGWEELGHFGAALTPLPDKSLLVYLAEADHPLGLVQGDIVLGYDGIPWHELYLDLIDAELPLTGLIYSSGFNLTSWGSNASSYEHAFLNAAGMNWHLFDTIDIQKYDTGDIVNLPTSLLVGQDMQLLGMEQFPIPGIPMPNPNNPSQWLTWGSFTRGPLTFGYINVLAHTNTTTNTTGSQFYQAVNNLMSTDGLIRDLRRDTGGTINAMNGGLTLLLETSEVVLNNAIRCGEPDSHLVMCDLGDLLTIPGDEGTYYDKPIAVLLGPGSYSAGDLLAASLALHPMCKLFGRSSHASANVNTIPSAPTGWYARYAIRNAYHPQPFPPDQYLTHNEFAVDVEVWFTQDDVALGIDTVLEAAICWMTPVCEVGSQLAGRTSCLVNCAPNPFNPRTEISFELWNTRHSKLSIYDIAGRLVHSVSLANYDSGHNTFIWDGCSVNGSLVASGMYIVQLETDTGFHSRKVMLLR
jgi:hypothetical protein